MSAATSPKTGSPKVGTLSPQNGYKGVGTLLKHWGTSETVAVDESQMKLCEDSGLDSLIHLARMPHVKVQGLAMTVINSLREGENGDIYIDSEEGFRPLVDLTKFAEEDVQREAVWSLAILASNSSCQARIEQEVGWHNFRKYAASAVPEIQAGTAILLGNLALEKKNQEYLMVKGVPLLMDMLSQTKDAKVRRAVVTALSNVSIIEGFGAKDVWLEKGIELMMPFIEQGDDIQLQIGALNTIANVCNHDKAAELKRKVAQLGGIGRLVPLLDSQDEMIVKLAAMTIANMASDDNHRNIMHGLHIEEPLIRLLDSRDEEVQLGVAMAINALAEHESTRSAFKTRQAAEPLKELIQVTKDRDIAKEAKEALKKISPEDYNALKLTSSSAYTSSGSSDSEEESESYTQSSTVASKESPSQSGESSSEGEGYSDSEESGSDEGEKELTASQQRQQKLREEQKAREEQAAIHEEEERRAEEDRKRIEEEETIKRSVDDVKKPEEPTNDNLRRSGAIVLSPKSQSEEEVRARRAEAARRREAGEDVSSDEESDYSSEEEEDGVERTPEEVQKRAEERRARRRETLRQREKESDDEGEKVDKGKGKEPAEDIPEPERRRREEEARRRQEEEDEVVEKKKEIDRKKREEEERKRKIEEEEFTRREAVELARKAEEAQLQAEVESPPDPRVGRSGRSGRRGSRSSRTVSSEFDVPKNPAKVLVMMLKEARHQKAVTKDALRELERFAARKERDQLMYGEDIIAILVYIIYFYPDAEYPDILLITLYLLALLARYHIKNQLAIRRARGGEQILRLMQSNVEAVRRNACLALGAYALNNKSVQTEVIRAIPLLSRLLETQETAPSTLRTVAACLAAIADNNPINQQQVITAGGLKAAMKLLFRDRHFTRSCLNLISAVVSHNSSAQNTVILENPRFINDLVVMLSTAGMEEYHDTIVNTIVEVTKKNPSLQLMLYHAGAVAKLVPLLSTFRVGGEEDRRSTLIVINALYLLITLSKLSKTKYARMVREELVTLKVTGVIQPLCASKQRQLAESALTLTKAVETR